VPVFDLLGAEGDARACRSGSRMTPVIRARPSRATGVRLGLLPGRMITVTPRREPTARSRSGHARRRHSTGGCAFRSMRQRRARP
jgi:hypothetical protein